MLHPIINLLMIDFLIRALFIIMDHLSIIYNFKLIDQI